MDEEFLNADEDDFETDEFDDDVEDEVDGESAADDAADEDIPDEKEPEEEKPAPIPTDHVVHVYEYGKFKRTIEREFTAEDAELFASDYNRTAKSYGRFALASKDSAKPKKTVPWPVGAEK